MRITRRTNLAMRILMYCAVNRDRTVTKAEIAAGCNASENHVGQIVNRLAHTGYLKTLRGRNGGLRLDRRPDGITVGGVFREFEQEVPLAECFSASENTCPLAGVCWLRDGLCEALDAFYRKLDEISLESLVAGNAGLGGLLAVPPARA